MLQGKKRSKSQVLGDKAVEIIKSILPTEWVTREYTPDYGIDLAVELFEEYDNNYITTGEHVYFQIKGTESISKGSLKVYERNNIEKLAEDYEKKILYKEIDVIKFSLDTALLRTVEKMSSAVPVLLIVVDLTNKSAYYICLNDYIEKVIIPTNPNYVKQKSLLINIPATNIMNNGNDVLPIRWYAKRAKLFALFSKANYQKHELTYMNDKNLVTDILHFAQIIRRLDAWSASKYFYPLKDVQEELDYFLENGIDPIAERSISSLKERGENIEEKCWVTNFCSEEISLIDSQNAMHLRALWDRLCNCGFILEDLSKEWFLPTYVGLITSS